MLLSIPYRGRDRPRVDSRRRSRQRRRTLSNISMYRRSQLRRIVLRCKRNPMLHPLRCRGSQTMLLLLTAQLLLRNWRLRRHRRSSRSSNSSQLLVGDDRAGSHRRWGSSYTLWCVSLHLALIGLYLYLRRYSPTVLLRSHHVHPLLQKNVRLLLM